MLSAGYIDAPRIVGDSKARGSVAFRGVGQSLKDDNVLAVAILTAADTAYLAIPSEVETMVICTPLCTSLCMPSCVSSCKPTGSDVGASLI